MSIHFATKEKIYCVVLNGTNIVLYYSIMKHQCEQFIERGIA